MKTIWSLALLLTALLSPVSAQTISFQGRLVNADGVAVPDGEHVLEILIYDSPLAGTVLWGPQVFDGTATTGHGPKVPTSDGRFSLQIGPADTANRAIQDAFRAGKAFVGIKVNGGEELLPRQELSSVPFAMNGNPTGTVVAFAGASAPPGWLLCDGSEHAKADYPALAAVVADAYGDASSAEKFRVPDLKGRTVIGVGQGDAPVVGGIAPANWQMGDKFGAEKHILTVLEMPRHNHDGSTSTNGSHTHSTSGPAAHDDGGGSDSHFALGDGNSGRGWPGINIDSAGSHSHTIPNSGGDQPHNNMQPSLVLNYIIKL